MQVYVSYIIFLITRYTLTPQTLHILPSQHIVGKQEISVNSSRETEVAETEAETERESVISF